MISLGFHILIEQTVCNLRILSKESISGMKIKVCSLLSLLFSDTPANRPYLQRNFLFVGVHFRNQAYRLSGSLFPIIVRLRLRFLDSYRRGVVTQLSFVFDSLKLDDTLNSCSLRCQIHMSAKGKPEVNRHSAASQLC